MKSDLAQCRLNFRIRHEIFPNQTRAMVFDHHLGARRISTAIPAWGALIRSGLTDHALHALRLRGRSASSQSECMSPMSVQMPFFRTLYSSKHTTLQDDPESLQAHAAVLHRLRRSRWKRPSLPTPPSCAASPAPSCCCASSACVELPC